MLLVVVFALYLVCEASGFIRATPQGFRDEYGRQRIFHGVNVVYKLPPWVPSTNGTWDPHSSMVEKDFSDLESWGFNFIRLGLMWPGVMPESSQQVNTSYLEVIEQLVSNGVSHNILTLLDLHQDLMSPFFCGEGAPDYLVQPYLPEGLSSFPLPISLPYKTNASNNNYPLSQLCQSKPFAAYYPTSAVGKTFQRLYDNADGFADALVRYWDVSSKRFQLNQGVVGYELLNEPYFGDVYQYPYLLESGQTDKRYLAPLYNRLMQTIRKNDQNHVVFFEPAVGDVGPSGFSSPPAGDNNTCYSYHVYCFEQPTPGDTRLCETVLKIEFDIKMSDVWRLQTAAMQTEFGAVGDDSNSSDWIRVQCEMCDAQAQSWAYWQYKYFHDITTAGGEAESFYFKNGTLQERKVKALSRTYAQAIQGTMQGTSFNVDTGAFSLIYQADVGVLAPTEVFVSPFYYSNGYNVTISPPQAASWKQGPKSRISITAIQNVVVKVLILAN